MDCLCRHGYQAFLLINVPCTRPECSEYGRMFDVQRPIMSDLVNMTFSASFFDVSDEVNAVPVRAYSDSGKLFLFDAC